MFTDRPRPQAPTRIEHHDMGEGQHDKHHEKDGLVGEDSLADDGQVTQDRDGDIAQLGRARFGGEQIFAADEAGHAHRQDIDDGAADDLVRAESDGQPAMQQGDQAAGQHRDDDRQQLRRLQGQGRGAQEEESGEAETSGE